MTVIKIYPDRDFTTLHNENIWDANLSNEAIGFWVRCVSMKPDWDFYITDLAVRMKCSKKAIYKHVKALEENRYCIRFDSYTREGKKITSRIVKYIFFMKPYKEEDKPALLQEIKKSHGQSDYGDVHHGRVHAESLEKKNSKKEELIEKNKQKDATSADASALCDFLLAKIKEKKPNTIAKVTPSWRKEAEKLLKVRTLSELQRVIEFMVADDFMGKWTFSMAKVSKHLDAAESQITGKTVYTKVGLETIQKRMEWAQQNEWSSPGGYAAAGEKAYETNGQKYEYTAVHPFWSNLGL